MYTAQGMAKLGLSPLARGTGDDHLRMVKRTRFIPARAGNGQVSDLPNAMQLVYPRSRGERAHPEVIMVNNTGLSPLARGTDAENALLWYSLRFIPARAGNGTL